MSDGSTETARMREALVAWGHARWPGCRAIHELVLGERRIDLVFVCERDIVGIEIKSSADRLDGRLEAQMKEFSRYLPEVWIAVAPKWETALRKMYRSVPNKLVVVDGAVVPMFELQTKIGGPGRRPYRDELSIMRLLELLWRDEAAAIADRTAVVPAPHSQLGNKNLYPMLARLLTGNEILAEVCRELRARPAGMVGRGSDPPRGPAERPAPVGTGPVGRPAAPRGPGMPPAG